jgi:hypothetical protein
MTGWGIVGAIVAAGLGSAGLVRLIDALARKRVVRVEAAERVNEMTLEWADAVQKDAARALLDATAARAEAAAARLEAEQAHRALRMARREIETIAARLVRLQGAIMAPGATVEALRSIANGDTFSTDRRDGGVMEG